MGCFYGESRLKRWYEKMYFFLSVIVRIKNDSCVWGIWSMVINGVVVIVLLSFGECLNGFNYIVELRVKVFGFNIELEFEWFIKDMCDFWDINNE